MIFITYAITQKRSGLIGPHHGDYGARGHVVKQAGVEGLPLQRDVVLSKKLVRSLRNTQTDHVETRHIQSRVLSERITHLQHLQTNQSESSLLKALDDLANQTPLNAIGLHSYQSPFFNARKI